MSDYQDTLRSILDQGAATAAPTTYGQGRGRRVVTVVPEGYTLATTDASDDEKHEPRPDHRRGTLNASDVASLAELIGKHATRDVEVYCDEKAGRVTALFDGGSAARPVKTDGDAAKTGGYTPTTSWWDWRAVLQMQPDPDWTEWAKLDGQFIEQGAFAEFLEQQAHNVVAPDYADLLEVAQSIEVSASTRFKSAARTSSGERTLIVDEQHDAKAGKAENLTIPTELTVRLKPWLDGEPVEVRVLFRYRISSAGLRLGIRLVRAEQVRRDAWLVLLSKLRDVVTNHLHLTGALVVNGTPPAARR